MKRIFPIPEETISIRNGFDIILRIHEWGGIDVYTGFCNDVYITFVDFLCPERYIITRYRNSIGKLACSLAQTFGLSYVLFVFRSHNLRVTALIERQ